MIKALASVIFLFISNACNNPSNEIYANIGFMLSIALMAAALDDLIFKKK